MRPPLAIPALLVVLAIPLLATPAGANLVTDPSFEAGITGWSPYEGDVLTRVPGGHTGSFALRCDSGGSTSLHFGIQDTPNWVDVVAGVGVRYRFTCWVRSDSDHGRVKIKVKEYLNKTQQGSTAYSSPITLSPTWQMATVDYVVTTAGSTLETVIEDYPRASGETYLIDDVSIEIVGDGNPPPPPPGDDPPVAKLEVTVASSPDLTVIADGSGSTDTDTTPIATYSFNFGDGSSTVTTTSSSRQHTYATGGTYTVTLVVTDTGGNASAPVAAQVTVQSTSTPPASGSSIAVYGGYYDTHHDNSKAKPNPWKGSSNVVFVGQADDSKGNYDASAVRVDNLTGSTLSGVVVTVDIGSKHYALWGTNSIPAGGHLVLTQTKFENFDGSDLNPAGCYSCSPTDCLLKVSHTIPVVHVAVGSKKYDYYDSGQILNTHGVDAAGCPYTGKRNDESQDWLLLSDTAPSVEQNASPFADPTLLGGGSFSLSPPFPNPTHGDFAIRFRTGATGVVRLAVYDVAGRLVRTCVDGILEPGEYTEYANLSGESPGLYFCMLRSPEGAQRRTFILVR